MADLEAAFEPIHRPVPVIAPGQWLGMMGGGQLGRMFCMAAQTLGYRVCVVDPDPDSPAGRIADYHVQAGYEDPRALAELARRCPAFTTEFENVPAASLRYLAEHGVVAPTAASVAIAQDRIEEKRFAEQAGLAVAPHRAILDEQALRAAPAELFPGILKVARLGYDGKGQARVGSVDEACQAFAGFGRVPCVLEQRIDLQAELSVVVARGFDGEVALYPVSRNVHRDGILAVSTVTLDEADPMGGQAQAAARRMAEALGYVGVMCVEFFVTADRSLIVNEMAPRPHNSGHYTIDACLSSQFEQQVRVMTGLPLGSTHCHGPSVMVNLLGDLWFTGSGDSQEPREPDWARLLRHGQARLHLYGKREPRRGRKMGHVTVLADTVDQATRIAGEIERDLRR